MDVSVVLTTYNGKKYIEELLESLRQQTKKIDELIVCDDGSTDGTPELIQKYIDKHNLSWKVQKNETNKGWIKNFRDGILQAKGDIIFPCDQDDIWKLDKIEKMFTTMNENKEILLLSSDYAPLYEKGGKTVELFKNTSTNLEKVMFNYHFATGNRPGCVMAIKRELLEKVKNIWSDWFPHDVFLWTCSNFFEGCYIQNEPLILYRRHDNNTTNHVTRDKKAVINSLKRNLILTNWMLTQKEYLHSYKEEIITAFGAFIKLRFSLLENKKIICFFKLFKYRKFYRSLKQEIGDLYLMIK